ncbi:MAG: MotA/TolQ/ExbB proton channel family protein, partial [Thermoguttaceae bacterium]|nr:MotA/TolQ/ExbB proton channel family protein [Thermoguttaceae bacterium]
AAPAGGDAAAGEAGAAAGETPAAGGGEENVKKQNYLSWMFHALGWFFTIVFSLLSLTMVALIVMNIVSLRRSVMAPEELTEEFGTLLDENKFQEAYELAKNDESLLGKVLATGLSRIPNGYEKATQAMQDVEQEETMRLEHQLGYLALIGNIAPMIGLFGTVVGMIASFQAIAAGGAAPSPQKLAEGIATALFTTELGLAIALPAIAAFDILKNRLSRFVLDVSVVSENFMGRFSNVDAQRVK